MNNASTQSKLAQLRAKTDHELSLIIDNRLESALNLLGSGEPWRAGAEEACAEALKLLPSLDDSREHRRLSNKLVQVRESLERFSTPDQSRVLRGETACHPSETFQTQQR